MAGRQRKPSLPGSRGFGYLDNPLHSPPYSPGNANSGSAVTDKARPSGLSSKQHNDDTVPDSSCDPANRQEVITQQQGGSGTDETTVFLSPPGSVAPATPATPADTGASDENVTNEVEQGDDTQKRVPPTDGEEVLEPSEAGGAANSISLIYIFPSDPNADDFKFENTSSPVESIVVDLGQDTLCQPSSTMAINPEDVVAIELRLDNVSLQFVLFDKVMEVKNGELRIKLNFGNGIKVNVVEKRILVAKRYLPVRLDFRYILIGTQGTALDALSNLTLQCTLTSWEPRVGLQAYRDLCTAKQTIVSAYTEFNNYSRKLHEQFKGDAGVVLISGDVCLFPITRAGESMDTSCEERGETGSTSVNAEVTPLVSTAETPRVTDLSHLPLDAHCGDGLGNSLHSTPVIEQSQPTSVTAMDIDGQTTRKKGRFVCDVNNCGKTFSSRSTLSRHKTAKHYGKKTTCPHCTKAFQRPYQLNEHVQKYHEGLL